MSDLRSRVAALHARRMGCEPARWDAPGVSVMEHAGLGGYRGVLCLEIGEAIVCSAPSEHKAALEALADEASARSFLDPVRLAGGIGRPVSRAIAAWLGYGTELAAPTSPAGHCELVDPDDTAALAALRADASDEEWAHAGLDGAVDALSAVVLEGRVVAACGWQDWHGLAAHLGVLVGRSARGRGLGAVVVGDAARRALAAGRLPQYQTALSNAPALAVARALGFRHVATSLALRLGEVKAP